jgi:hypothetical protein
MSGTQAVTFPVEDWLRALEREQARLFWVYIAMDVAIALAGLAMIVVSLSWTLPEHTSTTYEICYGGFYMLIAVLGSPLVIIPLNKKVSATAMAQVEASDLSSRVLMGTITGDEVHAILLKLFGRPARPNPDPSPAQVVHRVAAATYYYLGQAGIHWWFIVFPLLIGCVIWGVTGLWNAGSDGFSPALDSLVRFWDVIRVIGSGTALPLICLLGPRINTLFVVLPVLKRQWEAELERRADVQQFLV